MNPPPDTAFQRFILQTKYIRIIGRRLHPTYTVRVGNMRIALRIDGADEEVMREMFKKKPYLRHFEPQAGDLVVDAGANIGCFTLIAAELAGRLGRVVSFEPMKENFEMLRRNVNLNHLERTVTTNQMALGDSKEGEATLRSYEKFYSSSILESPRLGKPKKHEKVQVTSIDSLDLPRLDFLKLDTEGSEMSILKGAVRTLQRFHPKIAGEAHPDFSDSGAEIAEFLDRLGYETVVESSEEYSELFYAQ